MDHAIGFGVRSISKSIAVASEAIAARKEKKRIADQHEQPQDQIVGDRRNSDATDDEDVIDREWELDEAAQDLPPAYDEYAAGQMVDITPNTATTIISPPRNLKPIPRPVILPQRRPGTRSRGFIRAYAPSLGECSGINQQDFLQFLSQFDQASKASPVFDVINIACLGVGLVPSTICMAVSTGVRVATGVAKELQIRYKSNKFLDDANNTFFKPKGVYCMVMTYRPDSPDEAIFRADISDDIHGVALQKLLNREDSTLKQGFARLRKASGTVENDLQIPAPAPLVYPSLDRAIEAAATTDNTGPLTLEAEAGGGAILPPHSSGVANQSNEAVLSSATQAVQPSQPKSTVSPMSKLSDMMDNPAIQDYLDRRAQSEFTTKNPNSKLANTLPPQKKYVNRFADPNHPVNSGSIFGLVTGGTFDPIANGRIRRAERRARRSGEPGLTAEEKHDAYMGRMVRGKKSGTPSKNGGFIGRLLRQDILYLVVVNLPSAEERSRIETLIDA